MRADEQNKAEYEKRKDALLSAEAQRKEAAIKLADGMESLVISISAQVSEEGTLYGSVGTREIADSLIEKGFELEKARLDYLKVSLKKLVNMP